MMKQNACPLRGLLSLICLIGLYLSPSMARAEQGPLSFGLYPYANPTAVHAGFAPLVKWLAARSGQPIRIAMAPNYTAHVRSLGEGRIDLAFAGPSPFVKANDRYHSIELLARLRMKADSGDQTVLVARLDNPAQTLTDLRGRSFAFGDYQSFGSHFMPRHLLRHAGVSLWDLLAYDYVMGHDNVILAVLHGDFDAGAVRHDVFLHAQERERLKIIAGPVALSPHAIVCRKTLDGALKTRLRELLLTCNDREVLAAIDPEMTGFAPVVDGDFDLARRVIREIESP